MSESAIQLITGQLRSIEELMREERDKSGRSREKMHDKLDALEKEQATKFQEMARSMEESGVRIAALERSMLIMSPTVQEFVDLKTNAQVAGRLGKFLWKVGGVILAMAAGVASMWAAFWSYFNWR